MARTARVAKAANTNAQRAAETREEEGFGEALADEARRRCAEGKADGELTASDREAGNEKVRDVGPRGEEEVRWRQRAGPGASVAPRQPFDRGVGQ